MSIESLQFVPPTATVSRRLALQEFFGAYTSLAEKVVRRIFKLERLQTYQELGNPSYEAFVAEDFDRADHLIPEMRVQDADMYTSLFRRGVHFLRVRAVEFPLSPYLLWEFKTYKVTARYGESILVTDLSQEPMESSLKQSSDFILFDDSAVLIHDYGKDGILSGGWIVEDAAFIAKCSVIAADFIRKSVPLAVFERRKLGDVS